jgi:hypothetical protein
MATLRDLYAMRDRRMGPDPDWSSKFLEETTRKWQDYVDRQAKTEKEKLSAYTELRNAGYSKQQAYKKTLGKIGYDLPEKDITDLDTEKKQMDILKTKEDIKDKRLRRITGSAIGYDNPDEIPKFENGLPVKKIEQDKKSGKWHGVYGTTTGNKEDDFDSYLDKKEKEFSNIPPKQTAGESVFGKVLGNLAKGASSLLGGKKKQEKIVPQFAPEAEQLITENMTYYKKSREEVISALKAKGLI